MIKPLHELLTIVALLIVPSLVYCFNENLSDEVVNSNDSQKTETPASTDSFSTLSLLPVSQQIIISPYNESEHSLDSATAGTTVALRSNNNPSPSVYDFITATSSIPTTTSVVVTTNSLVPTNSYAKTSSHNEYSQYADENFDNIREGGARYFPDGFADVPSVQLPPAISNYESYTQPQAPVATVPSSPYLGNFDTDDTYYTANDYVNQRTIDDFAQPIVDSDDVYVHQHSNNNNNNNQLPNSVPIVPSLLQHQAAPSTYNNEPATLGLYSSTSTVPTPRSTKQSKQILTYKSSADEVLRNFVKDSYLRTPTAILIDTSGKAHDKAQTMWKATLLPNKSLQNAALDMVLVTYNSSGVGITQNFKNSKSLITQLNQMPESSSKGGQAFNGILRASEMIPYDSAIFLSTQFVPTDYDLEHLAAITLLKKRTRLYLIWFGEGSLDENDTSAQGETGGKLGELALRTGGEILHVPDEAFGPNGDLGLITLFIQNNLRGPGQQDFSVPVDSTVSSLLIKTLGNVETATLSTPNGRTIDLTSRKAIEEFSVGSTQWPGNNRNGAKYEKSITTIIQLEPPLPGLYLLRIKAKDTYSVIVKGRLRLALDVTELESTDIYSSRQLEEFNVEVPDVEIINIGPKSARQTVESVDDETEDDYSTLANANVSTTRNLKNILPSITKIDIGLQSQLIATPGTTVQLYFEVTNLRNEASFHNFQVTDEKSYLRTLQPQSFWLPPGQMSTVIVSAYIPPNAEIGSSDKIVFKSQGIGSVQQAAMLFVSGTASGNQDNWQPHIWYTYGSRCEGQSTPGTCAGGVWSLEITVQDYESGTLRIDSTPRGIIYRSTYTAGTREPVKATYTASCCSPRVSITAYDLNKNQRSVQLDVYDIWLNEAGIAAVVLGCLLLILLIVLLVILCVYCARKRKRQQELPIYVGSAQRSARPSRQERMSRQERPAS